MDASLLVPWAHQLGSHQARHAPRRRPAPPGVPSPADGCLVTGALGPPTRQPRSPPCPQAAPSPARRAQSARRAQPRRACPVLRMDAPLLAPRAHQLGSHEARHAPRRRPAPPGVPSPADGCLVTGALGPPTRQPRTPSPRPGGAQPRRACPVLRMDASLLVPWAHQPGSHERRARAQAALITLAPPRQRQLDRLARSLTHNTG